MSSSSIPRRPGNESARAARETSGVTSGFGTRAQSSRWLSPAPRRLWFVGDEGYRGIQRRGGLRGGARGSRAGGGRAPLRRRIRPAPARGRAGPARVGDLRPEGPADLHGHPRRRGRPADGAAETGRQGQGAQRADQVPGRARTRRARPDHGGLRQRAERLYRRALPHLRHVPREPAHGPPDGLHRGALDGQRDRPRPGRRLLRLR